MENPLIHITIIDRKGEENTFEAPTDMGLNLMELCKANEVAVKGECGGMAMCATCQVYVLSDHALPEPSDDELGMLDQAFFVKNNSRLGCQLHLSPEMDGLKVQLAPEND
ncbi:MAG: 2Fe-2S iron-sulfur cluster binding domain-containing protein [Sphingomonadales bacterium]|nr:2Fe-2S iron-sulfur cluster binding domain-containing protein [Sphingomonadales bacterium]